MVTAFIRTILLYCILMVGLRLMGKRQIGELEPSELVLTLIISDLAAVPMQDFGIPLVNGVLPIITLFSLSMLLSFISLKSVKFRALACGHPTILVQNGKIQQQAMSKNRFTVDELFEQLRSQGLSDLSSVKYAILETNGSVSVLPYAKDSPATPQILQLELQDNVTLPLVVINDGRIIQRNLEARGLDQAWLDQQLSKRNIPHPKYVFLLTVDEAGSVVCVPKEG